MTVVTHAAFATAARRCIAFDSFDDGMLPLPLEMPPSFQKKFCRDKKYFCRGEIRFFVMHGVGQQKCTLLLLVKAKSNSTPRPHYTQLEGQRPRF